MTSFSQLDCKTCSAVISACAAVASCVVAIWSLVINKQIESRTVRPIVAVDIENASGIYSVIVKNSGLIAARNVRIAFHPPILIRLSKDICGPVPFIENPIPTLLPGSSYSCGIANHEGLYKFSAELRFTVDVNYENTDGKLFRETVKLDVRAIADSAIVREKNIVAEKLDNIAKALVRQNPLSHT